MEINKEIWFKSQQDYLNTLFGQLKEKKIKYYQLNGISGVNDDLSLMFYGHPDEEKKKLDDFEKFVWQEYEKIFKERKEMENE